MSFPNSSLPASTSPSGFSVNPDSVTRPASRESFVDRRSGTSDPSGRPERRQFGSSHSGLSGAGHELALAIDQYKAQHHRRYLTCDEMLRVLSSLGYAKQS